MPGTSWWVNDVLSLGGPFLLVSWIVWVIGSIVLHELGHGWAAMACGDRTPVESGHMTWNPVVHMGWHSLLAFTIIGIAWGQMPVNPGRLRGRHADAKVAFAGPIMNLGLAATAILLGGFWLALGSGHVVGSFTASPPVFADVQRFFMIGAGLNLLLFVLNMLPIPPLDGSRILAHFVRRYGEFIYGPQGQALMIVGLVAAVYFIGPRMYGWSFDLTRTAIMSIGNILTGGAFVP